METANLLFKLRKSGFLVRTENSKLQISPAKELTDELKKTIRQSKTEIMCALHREDELRRLVLLVSKHNGFSQEHYEEALTHALCNPVDAMTCFASLASKAGLL